MDYNNVYQPPVLAKVNLQSDDESDDSSHSSFSTSNDDDLTDAEVDNEGVAILPPQEFSDDEIPSPKKKDKKKPVKMTCSGRQLVSLLEELLSFHSWYKYGEAPFGPNYENGDANDLLLLLRQMMASTIAFCPREDGNGWKLQKLHEQLHLAIALVFFRHTQNFNAGSGERLLKDFFKKLAQMCQQHGQDTFIHQVSCHLQELQRSAKRSCMTPICLAATPLLQHELHPPSVVRPAHNLPRIDSVPVVSIQDNLIVVEEMPGLCKSWHGTRYVNVWLAKNRKLEWPSMFHISA
jgi:hypothetical protein